MTKIIKCAIVADGRTGTNLLWRTLGQHPNIMMHPEIFNPGQKLSKMGFNTSEILDVGFNPHHPIAERIGWPPGCADFGKCSDDILVVGFTVHLNQMRDRYQDVLRSLESLQSVDSSVKVICLRRLNLLERYISVKIARKTLKYVVLGDDDYRSNLTLRLCPHLTKKDFVEHTKRWRKFHENYNINALHLTYEDLNKDFISSIKRCASYLQVPEFDWKPATIKMEHRDLRHVITNYSELKRFFSGTVWSHFFKEDKRLLL